MTCGYDRLGRPGYTGVPQAPTTIGLHGVNTQLGPLDRP
jgi:hypothetical protein